MTNKFEGYWAVTSLIIELEQKLKVFWNGGEQGFTKQASKLIKKNNLRKCVHIFYGRVDDNYKDHNGNKYILLSCAILGIIIYM